MVLKELDNANCRDKNLFDCLCFTFWISYVLIESFTEYTVYKKLENDFLLGTKFIKNICNSANLFSSCGPNAEHNFKKNILFSMSQI